MSSLAPLDDPTYEPKHPPMNGGVPDVVAKWGPRSQVRWFRRFALHLDKRRDRDQYYCANALHRGMCCHSCEEEFWEYSTGVMMDGYCCCKGARTEWEQS